MVREVESEIARRLKAKYLQDPQVLARVKDAVGMRVAVQGAVRTSGVQVRGDTTLTNLIAQAQGFTDTADKSSVVIRIPIKGARPPRWTPGPSPMSPRRIPGFTEATRLWLMT